MPGSLIGLTVYVWHGGRRRFVMGTNGEEDGSRHYSQIWLVEAGSNSKQLLVQYLADQWGIDPLYLEREPPQILDSRLTERTFKAFPQTGRAHLFWYQFEMPDSLFARHGRIEGSGQDSRLYYSLPGKTPPLE